MKSAALTEIDADLYSARMTLNNLLFNKEVREEDSKLRMRIDAVKFEIERLNLKRKESE